MATSLRACAVLTLALCLAAAPRASDAARVSGGAVLGAASGSGRGDGAGGDNRCPCMDCIAAGELVQAVTSDAAVEAALGFARQQCGGCPVCEHTAASGIPSFARWLAASWELQPPSRMCEGASEKCGSHPQLLAAKRMRSHHLTSPLVGDPTTCAMCAFVVDQVKVLLNDTKTQEAIKEKLLVVCAQLPAELSANCNDLVNTYEPVIVDWIEKVDTTSLCAMAGACLVARTSPPPRLPARLVAALAKARENAVGAAATSGGGGVPNDSCDVCQMAVIEAHALVTNPTVQADLVNYTHDLCGLIAGPFNMTCNAWIDEYAPATFDALEKYLTPQLCTDIGICQAYADIDASSDGLPANAAAMVQRMLQRLQAFLGGGGGM